MTSALNKSHKQAWNMPKKYLLLAFHLLRLITGLVIYVLNKKTPDYAYQSMIFLFCRSRGRFNDLLSWLIKAKNGTYRFNPSGSMIGDLNAGHREKINASLLEHGYYIFDSKLPAEVCDRLLNYALKHPCNMCCMDDGSFSAPIRTTYDRDNPQAVRYDFDVKDLLQNEDVQSIIADEGFATVAQDYLGSKPIIDIVTMWWHTRFSDKPDMAAAQYFHFDMDRPKWLKFFIYLTDVDTDNGPHTFVAGTHKAGAIPAKLLNKGYARLNDSEVHAEFDNSQFIEFNAPRGTIIVEDTRGLHKGKHVENGDRLIFQIEYCNSLFGGVYQKTTCDAPKTTKLNEMFKKYKAIYKLYL